MLGKISIFMGVIVLIASQAMGQQGQQKWNCTKLKENLDDKENIYAFSLMRSLANQDPLRDIHKRILAKVSEIEAGLDQGGQTESWCVVFNSRMRSLLEEENNLAEQSRLQGIKERYPTFFWRN
jgi:hypothetical protein